MQARADYIRILNPGDAESRVMVQHSFPTNEVERAKGNILFNASTGEIEYDHVSNSIRFIVSFLEGAHFMRFDSTVLRWLLFFAGLAGTAMIASGLIVWLQSRMKNEKHAMEVKVVNALSIGTIIGMIGASIAFMLVNRSLMNEASLFGLERAALEVSGFVVVWIASYIHASVRGEVAWFEQTVAIAVLALITPMANWFSTGMHPLIALQQGQWEEFSVDLMLLSTCLVCILVGICKHHLVCLR